MTARVLAFAGSARRASWNKLLIRAAADAARAAGGEVTLVDLADYPLPLMDEDHEAEHGVPENARRLKQLMKEHDGLLLACPEYNSSITPLLKNVIDWCSRSEDGERPLECFDGKVAALCAASPGALGGLRGLVTVRMILGNIRVLVVPEQVAVPKAHEAFGEGGELTNERAAKALRGVATALVNTVSKLRA